MANADQTSELIQSLDDSSKWLKITRVSVFKPHTAVADDGTQYTVSDRDLNTIAANTNRSYQRNGHPVRLTVGHLDRRSPTAQQPPFAGFALNYSAKIVERPGGPVLRLTHDEYVLRSMSDRWRSLPYRSVEYDRHNQLIRGCAGIIETPRLELGAVIPYAASDRVSSVIYYSTGELAVMNPNDSTTANGDEMGDESQELQQVAAKVAEILMPQIQSMITEALKGSTGGVTPPPESQNSNRRGEDQYAELNSQLAAVRAELTASRRDQERQVCERMIDTIEGHYSFDRAEEVQYLLSLPANARSKRLEYLRKNLRPLPTGSMIRVAQPAIDVGENDAPLTREEAYAASEYRDEKKCSWEQAYSHVRSQRKK